VASGVRLDVSNLEVRLGRTGADVVGDVSFAVQAGQVLGLVGESGSGKTTVVLALLGHSRRGLRISAGQVHVDGVDLLRLPPAELRAFRGARVAYVPQDPSAALNPALRVGMQLKLSYAGAPGASTILKTDPMSREVHLEVRPTCSGASRASFRRPAAARLAGGLRLPPR
jgi:peptide/nickel transport system ATP-binding protein